MSFQNVYFDNSYLQNVIHNQYYLIQIYDLYSETLLTKYHGYDFLKKE